MRGINFHLGRFGLSPTAPMFQTCFKHANVALNSRVEPLKRNIMNVNLWLDTRRELRGGGYPLKVSLSSGGLTRAVSTGVRLSEGEWDMASREARGRDSSRLNMRLASMLRRSRDAVSDGMPMSEAVEAVRRALSAKGVEEVAASSLRDIWQEFASSRRSAGTRRLYAMALAAIERWHDTGAMSPSDVTRRWLETLDAEMTEAGMARNTRLTHLRLLRAVVYHAMSEGLSVPNPFKGFNMTPAQTRHRAMSVSDLRLIRDAPLDGPAAYVRDMFMLSFYLIGINPADMIAAEDYDGERLRYARAKTGKPYDVKVEPEARLVIEAHRGPQSVLDIGARYSDSNALAAAVRRFLKPIRPDVTLYWARHTWATLAAELDVPMEVISAALGHSMGVAVTRVYVAVKRWKVDRANRLVLDYLASDATDPDAFLQARAKP